ncbi:MAG: trehalase-like domain-containing protein [Mycobacteriales bacterium]
MTLRIEDYAVIGDLQTAALVGRDGSVDWLCLPRFDSPACFSALLDAPRAGRWLLAPADGGTATSRSYVEESLVLEQVWETGTGAVRVLDLIGSAGFSTGPHLHFEVRPSAAIDPLRWLHEHGVTFYGSATGADSARTPARPPRTKTARAAAQSSSCPPLSGSQ